jgi:hypothetical protein
MAARERKFAVVEVPVAGKDRPVLLLQRRECVLLYLTSVDVVDIVQEHPKHEGFQRKKNDVVLDDVFAHALRKGVEPIKLPDLFKRGSQDWEAHQKALVAITMGQAKGGG